jgi:CRP/FNR family cyclic AMP-dependent transcriptional regulator
VKSEPFDLQLLAGVPLFADLGRDELHAVASVARQVTHRPGEVVVKEGSLGGRFFVIQDGTADVIAREMIQATLGPGAYFGELSVLDGERRSASVVATSSMTTWSIADFNFRPLLKQHPALAVGLLTALSRRLRAAERSLMS